VSEVVVRPKLARTLSAPEGQRWQEIAEHEWPEGIAEAPAVKEARILGGRRSVRVWREGRAFRVRLGLADTRVFEECLKTGIGRETRLKQGPEERGIHCSSGILKFTLG